MNGLVDWWMNGITLRASPIHPFIQNPIIQLHFLVVADGAGNKKPTAMSAVGSC
jgi:hypothetical protein